MDPCWSRLPPRMLCVVALNVWHLLVVLLFGEQIFGRILPNDHIFLRPFNVIRHRIRCAFSLTSDVVRVTIVLFLRHVRVVSHCAGRVVRVVDRTNLV